MRSSISGEEAESTLEPLPDAEETAGAEFKAELGVKSEAWFEESIIRSKVGEREGLTAAINRLAYGRESESKRGVKMRGSGRN